MTGKTEGIDVTDYITVYAALNRVDLDIRIHKPVTTEEQRIVQIFSIQSLGEERIETTGAVIRPALQPAGDLLPGADANRFAVQGSVDLSEKSGPGVSIAPLDAFLLRRDLGPVTFEALGNDQNYKEATRDQHGVTDFRFRYALRSPSMPYDGAEVFMWSRSVANPFLVGAGSLAGNSFEQPSIEVDPATGHCNCV